MKTEADFAFDFGVKSVVSSANGDLFLEGWASEWGEDFQGEAFEPGAFTESLDHFLSRNPVCLYNDDTNKPLGVIEYAEVRPNGLWVKARIEKPAPGSWADREDVYQRIARGSIRGFSVAGAFFRRPSEKGLTKIFRAILSEISITPQPVNWRCVGAVSTAQKAFDGADNSEVAELANSIQELKQEAMKLPGFPRKPQTRPAPIPRDNRELRAADAERARQEGHYRNEVSEETVTTDTARLFGIGYHSRDKFGDRRRDSFGNVIDDEAPTFLELEEQIPSEISGEDLARMMGVQPKAATEAEETPEQAFRRMAEEAERKQWAETISAKFDALRRDKEQSNA